MNTDLNSSPWRGNRFHIFNGWCSTFSGSRFQWTPIWVLVIPSEKHPLIHDVKEPCCWITKQELHLQLKQLQVDASLSIHKIIIRHICKKKKKIKKRNVLLSLTWCSVITGYCRILNRNRVAHSGCLLSVDMPLVMYGIPPTHSLWDHNVELVFHIAWALLAGQFAATSSNNCPCTSSLESFCVSHE